jgi:hypothetical protein
MGSRRDGGYVSAYTILPTPSNSVLMPPMLVLRVVVVVVQKMVQQ